MILDAALGYATRGWFVFPVPPNAKRSHMAGRFSNGQRWGATTDPDEIEAAWLRWPDAGVGIACGPESGLFVIEADTLKGHGGPDGVSNLGALIRLHGGGWPATAQAVSPSGSRHVYFTWPADVGVPTTASVVAPGVDVRGRGGMVVAPPTRRRDGCYRWINPPHLVELAPCPSWLLALCVPPERPAPAPYVPPSGPPPAAWGAAALRGGIADVLAATKGARNREFNRIVFKAAQIVAGGGLSEEHARAALLEVALTVGLEPGETQRTINSAMRAGMAHPRTAAPRERQNHA